MVKVCRVPKFSRQVFTANELSGWADGVAYSPDVKRERRRKAAKERRAQQLVEVIVTPPPPIERVDHLGYST